MRFEVWDWDYGGDDVDDLLGQITFQGESVVAAAAAAAAADGEKPEIAVAPASYRHGGSGEKSKEEEEGILTTLQELLAEGRDGKTNEDLLHDFEETQRREDRERMESMTGSGSSVTHVVYGNTKYNAAGEEKKSEEEEAAEKNMYKEGPSFLRHRKLKPMPKESIVRVPGEKKFKKPKTINVKGTVSVGVRVEPSSASRAARRMEREEKEASASAFELWPELFVADLSHNRIMQLPRGVRGWKKIRRLHLGGNTLSVLPNEFCCCQSLENLNLADNQLVSLPENFGHLSKLMNLRLDRNKLTHVPQSTYTITTLRQLHLADNPLKPIDGVKLWHHGDPILRFKDTAKKLLEVEPTPVRRMEPGTRIFDTTLYTRKIRTDGGPDERGQGPQADHVRFDSILCADFFSSTGCRYGAYCMFSHIPEPLPVVPFQRTKEKMSKEDVRMKVTSHNKKPVNFYGITHQEYDELWAMLEEDDADGESDSDSSDDEE
jgi:Leucine-rich repeat (LRR) protein